jgi:hypothetical protein
MWNLFKAQLIAEYTPTTFNFADLNKVGKHGRYTESLYRRHFDITSGGLIIPRPDVPLVFEAVSVIYSNQNRFNLNANSKVLSSQLRFDHTFYWTARIIDSPTAVIITLFPGIWTDMFFSPNFGVGSRVWVNALAMSMYLQKNTVIGIRISKLPPYLVTPWSGAMFKTFDSGLSASTMVGSIMDVVTAEIKLMSAILYNGNPNILDFLISAYQSLYSSIISQDLINTANQIPSIYGDDFRGIDLKNNTGVVEAKVLSNITDFCNGFLSKIVNASALASSTDSTRPITNFTILTGILGLDELKKKWIDENKNLKTIVIDYNEIRFEIAKQYYETWVFDGVRIVRGNIPYENEFAEGEFFQSEYSNYEFRYLRPTEIRPRYILFNQVIDECIKRIVNALLSGTSVIFNARNIEKQDRLKIYNTVKSSIETVIQTEFLEEFNLYLNESKNSFDTSRWTREQVSEYNDRLKNLNNIIIRNKIFFPDDLLTKKEKDELSDEQKILMINERLYESLNTFYKPEYFTEDKSFALSTEFLKGIINIQRQRFGYYFRDDVSLQYNNIFMNEDYILI